VSSCSAIILTSIFGDNFSYIDDSEVPFRLPKRTFKSFKQATAEASISSFTEEFTTEQLLNGVVQVILLEIISLIN
jgi:hypothetical protein